MKKITLSVLVLTITTLLMGALIGGVYALTDPVIKRNQHKVLVEAAENIYEGSDTYFYLKDVESEDNYSDLQKSYNELTDEQKEQVKDILLVYNGTEFMGLIYIEEGGNQYGTVKLAVSISADNQMTVKAVNFEQTPGIGENAMENYENNLNNVPLDTTIEMTAGATVSSTLIQSLIDQALEKHASNEEAIEVLGILTKDPLVTVFGKDYEKTKDESFTPDEIVTEKYNIKGSLTNGISLVGTKQASFETAYTDVEGEISLEVFLNDKKEVVSYEFLKYEHSEGNYMKSIEAHLEYLIGKNLENYSEILLEIEGNPFAGATKTGTLAVQPILEAMAGRLDPLKEIYGENYESTLDETFEPTEKVLEKYNVTGDKEGTIYIGSYSRSFDTQYTEVKGEVKLRVSLDNEGVILGIDVLTNEHSPGYDEQINSYLNSFIGTNISDIEAIDAENQSLYAGATQTVGKTMYPILQAIKEVYAS